MKKTKLQITKNKFQIIETTNQKEENLIKELNKDFYRFEKKLQREKGKKVSIDKYNYEFLLDTKDPLEELLTIDKREKIRKAIDELDELDKYIFLLKVERKLSFDKISKIVKLSKTAVIKRYASSILKLRELLSEYQ